MRNLNLEELSEKISDYSSNIKYSDRNHLEVKITQFLNFLYEQPISRRTLERISEDFNKLESKIKESEKSINNIKARKEIIELLNTREMQGAFSYFEIKSKFGIEKKRSNHYIELSDEWYSPRGGNSTFDKWQEYFNTYFFEPFIELIEWYFRESKIKEEKDFFSREEINRFNNNFDLLKEQIQKLEFGQEIIFNEADEIKSLINGLNKKNWIELIKGKFRDLILEKVISLENAESLIKFLTGEDINLK